MSRWRELRWETEEWTRGKGTVGFCAARRSFCFAMGAYGLTRPSTAKLSAIRRTAALCKRPFMMSTLLQFTWIKTLHCHSSLRPSLPALHHGPRCTVLWSLVSRWTWRDRIPTCLSRSRCPSPAKMGVDGCVSQALMVDMAQWDKICRRWRRRVFYVGRQAWCLEEERTKKTKGGGGNCRVT